MRDNPVLELEGVHNFRDHGGWAVAGGGRLKRGMLWRSGEHADASAADLAKIASLGLANVFDLRSGTERAARPCRRPEGFSGQVHINDDDIRQQAPHVVAAKGAAKAQSSTLRGDPETARAGMRTAYTSFPFRPKLVAMIRLYLEVLARGEGPSLINCMAGKDRTGIAVAVLHLAAGVHPDDAIADYVLTNTAGNLEARIAAGARSIAAVSGEVDEAALRVVMGVEPEYLEAAFAGMRERNGSIDGYLREVVGVDDALRARLREHLVEG
ncbi:MAG: tyrosine-protein phosphatase [Novosphingobium sp.]